MSSAEKSPGVISTLSGKENKPLELVTKEMFEKGPHEDEKLASRPPDDSEKSVPPVPRLKLKSMGEATAAPALINAAAATAISFGILVLVIMQRSDYRC
jgi:hypothetical protein